MKKYVSYVRVSTQKQGDSGLGLEAQTQAVLQHVSQNNGKVLASYIEVESGKNNSRPELAKALLHAKRSKAILIVAKLDRLARKASFLLKLIESGADVIFADMPNIPEGPTGKLIITHMASIAEWEAGIISQRTKAAMAVLKARGVKLGSHRPGHWDGKEHLRLAGLKLANKQSIVKRQEISAQRHAELCPEIIAMRNEGLTLQAISDRLNAEEKWTPTGKKWYPVRIHQLLAKCKDA